MLDTQDWKGEHHIRAPYREPKAVKPRAPLSERQALVFAEIEKRQPVQTCDMKGVANLSWPQLCSTIMQLVTKGYVSRQGQRNGTLRVIP